MRHRALVFAFIVILFPATALANSGTPLMWAGLLHLTLGNAVIGILEGVLLGRIFGLSKRRCVAWMVAANYLSAWVGKMLLSEIPNSGIIIDLESAAGWLWTLVAAAYFWTLFLELPFVFFAIGKVEKRFRKALVGNLAVQSVSYALLFGWYWVAGNVSLLRDLKTVRLSEMNVAQNVMVYCVPIGLDQVCVGSLADGKFIGIQTPPSEREIDRLAVEKAGTNWNLIAVSFREGAWPVLTNLTSQAVEDPSREVFSEFPPTREIFGRPTKLSATRPLEWEFYSSYWSFQGVFATNEKLGLKMNFAFETPIATWKARNGTVLPDGKFLFQLGEDQICLLDVERREIALVVRGRGPVVAVER